MINNQPQQTTQSPQQVPPKKKSNVALIIIIVVAILLILGIGGGYYLYWQAKQAVQRATENLPATTPDETGQEEETLPSSDVAGTDIEGIPRYPGSVRTEYAKDPESPFTSITYKVKKTKKEIFDYYKEQLPKNNWQLSGAEEDVLTFSKGGSSVEIAIYEEGKTITEYRIWHYAPEED